MKRRPPVKRQSLVKGISAKRQRLGQRNPGAYSTIVNGYDYVNNVWFLRVPDNIDFDLVFASRMPYDLAGVMRRLRQRAVESECFVVSNDRVE